MADPLSIIASITGLVALGVKVSNGLAQIISEAKAVDALLTELTNDLLVLCTILAEVEAISTWRESAGDHLLPAALERCDRTLKDLQAIIEIFQKSVARGGLQKRWLQATWASKQKQIASISARISEHKSTLTLALQMQNASDMRGVKTAINTFLESKIVHCEINEPRRETLERYVKSKAASLYSLDHASSFTPSITSFATYRNTPEQTRSDTITLNGSGNWETESSSETSSLTLALLPPPNMESIHIPPCLLGPDVMSAEKFWSELAPNLPTASPAPYSTFKERYLSVFPYLWLHGRIWHGDRATVGTLLVSRYSTQSGKMELSRVQAICSREEPRDTSYRETPEYLEAEAATSLEDAMLRLSIQDDPAHFDHSTVQSPYSFHRILPMLDEQSSSSTGLEIWPPMVFPANDRTTRSSWQRALPGDRPEYSLNLFGLRKTNAGLNYLRGSRLELFAALDPHLYTPDIEHPLRGIWYKRTRLGYEFTLIHQSSRNFLVGLKLTGNVFVPRGEKSIEFKAIGEGILNGDLTVGYRAFNSRISLETPVFEPEL